MARRSRLLSLALAWAPAVLYMALIWGLSSIRIEGLPVSRFPMKDKGIHFVEFGVLGFLVAYAARRTWKAPSAARVFAAAAVIAFAWGVLDELHQGFVPGRDGDVYDIIADGLGSIAGTFALFTFAGLRASRRSRKAAS